MLDLRHAAAARLEFLSPGKRPREQMRRDTIPSSELEARREAFDVGHGTIRHKSRSTPEIPDGGWKAESLTK